MSLTVTDLFAGAGGSSTGMVEISGVQVRIAANHWQLACDVHNANHPDTDHAAVDLHQEDPAYFPRTDVLWASPECTKWSQANGSKPLPAIEEGLFEDPLSDEATRRSRLLMFDVLKFVEHHRYRYGIIENVVDICTQVKYATAWQAWRRNLANLGYSHRVVSLNSMHAQAFGMPAPQSRDRIYIHIWPTGEQPPDVQRILRPRAWCPSCGSMVESQQAWKNGKTVGRYRQSYVYIHGACGTVVEPGWLPALAALDLSDLGERIGDRLKPKTRARIAAGIARYWGPIHIEDTGNQYDAADPKHPQHGDPNAYFRAWAVDDVLRTLHTRESKALVVPVEGRDGKQAADAAGPLRTMTTRAETALVGPPFVAELRGGSCDARAVTEPAGTFTAGGNHHALVSSYYGASMSAHPADEPMGTLTTHDRHALIVRNNGVRGGNPARHTTPPSEYLRTLTTTASQALIQRTERAERRAVTPADLRAAEEMVPECLFRMFRPHEVAAGMAFPDTYDWHPDKTKTTSNRDMVKMAGNAVTPPAARDQMHVAVATLGGAA